MADGGRGARGRPRPGLAPVRGGEPEHTPGRDRGPPAGPDPGGEPAARGQAPGRARAGRHDACQPARPAGGSPGAVDHERGRDPPGRRHLHHRPGAPAAGLAPGLRVLQGSRCPGPGDRDAARRGDRQRPAGRRADHAGTGRAPGDAPHRASRRRGRRRPVQHPGHRVPRRRVRGGRQLPPRPVHAHHQHPRQGQPRAHRGVQSHAGAGACRPRGDRGRTPGDPRPPDGRGTIGDGGAQCCDHVEAALAGATRARTRTP